MIPIGLGPKWALAQMGQDPNEGPGPNGPSPKWARAQMGDLDLGLNQMGPAPNGGPILKEPGGWLASKAQCHVGESQGL